MNNETDLQIGGYDEPNRTPEGKEITAMGQWNAELERRLTIIVSEPNGTTRDTMIDNLLVGKEDFLTTEREQHKFTHYAGSLYGQQLQNELRGEGKNINKKNFDTYFSTHYQS